MIDEQVSKCMFINKSHDSPISFSVNLVEFETFVDDSVVAFDRSVAREADPNLVVNHSP